jgi:SAM-dependent methyltransferase
MHRVDYDRVAALYDEPARDHHVDANLLAFLEGRNLTASEVRILDVGCGTGKQLAANRRRVPGLAVGVDRFAGMLRIAHQRSPGSFWLQADGARLPLLPGVFHYATCQFAYPHIGDIDNLLREIFRVLRSCGRFVMTNIDPWSMPKWLIYQYFPKALELDRQDFVQVEQFATLMRNAGFRDIQIGRDDLSRPEELDDFLAFASARHRASQLMAIPDADYEAGIRRIRETLSASGRATVLKSEFVLVTIAGDKP